MDHEHNADPAIGPVCSHLVTDEMLCAWGLQPVLKDKVCGTLTIIRDGIPLRTARHEAWLRGHTVLCSIAPVGPKPFVPASSEWVAMALEAFPKGE